MGEMTDQQHEDPLSFRRGCKITGIVAVVLLVLIVGCGIMLDTFMYDCEEGAARSASGRHSDKEWEEYRDRCLGHIYD